MRALCRGAGGAGAGAADALAAGARLVALRVPGPRPPHHQPLHFVVEARTRVRELRALVCRHMCSEGMLDTDIFGLAQLYDGEYIFADLDSKLSKYAPKSWRSSHTHGLDGNGRPLLELHLAVQFYVESPLLLGDELSRQNYYQQLRSNLATRDVLPPDAVLLLAGLALQADHGDAHHYEDRDYFQPRDYAPPQLIGDWVATAIRACHRDNRGLSKDDARTRFIREACILPHALNCHRYRMRAFKTDVEPGSVWLAICTKGIKILPEEGSESAFVWNSIGKLSFDKKKFEIRTDSEKITLYSSSDEKSKYLLNICKETHQFSMKIASKLSEILMKEEEERKDCYGYDKFINIAYDKGKNDQRISVISSTSSNTTSGIVSDRVHSEDELEIMIDSPPAQSTESLAFAHLLDYSKNYLLKPFSQNKLVKTTSLQHQKSKPSSSNKDKSTIEIPTNNDDLQLFIPNSSNSEYQLPNSKGEQSTHDSPVSSNLKCTGSQCSSSCSTVIMARAGISIRRPSNTSSLELGYSHTAQNSLMSDTPGCVDINYTNEEDTSSALYDGLGQAATLAASSETSGVYTMDSSEITGQTSEIAETETESRTDDGSHYGHFRQAKEKNISEFDSVSSAADSVNCEQNISRIKDLQFRVNKNGDFTSVDCTDGNKKQITNNEDVESDFRGRSNSNISIQSFHGDGSDPTDKKRNLLSALELSDLIVGKGEYPKRQSVSDTMDSVSDYVRLPLPLEGESYIQGHEDTAPSEEHYPETLDTILQRPPTPPKRIDSWKQYNMSINTSLPNILDCISDDLSETELKTKTKQPPPYNFKHITLNETHVSKHLEDLNLSIPTNDPPPYPGASKVNDKQIPARIVTTKPMISMLTSATGPVSGINKSKLNIYGRPVSNDIPDTYHSSWASLSSNPYIHNTNSLRNLHVQKHSRNISFNPRRIGGMSNISETSLLVPMLKPTLPTRLLPPPPALPRQPPPPPPIATALCRTQLEQYQQQLYSDVDYVIYPLQDPAISQQNYLDSKLASNVGTGNSSHMKNSPMYRSAPFLSASMTSMYSSTQNLSDSYVHLPGMRTSIYSPSSQALSGSRLSLYCERPSIPKRPKMPLPFVRTKSDESISKVGASSGSKRLPPPPPPPPYNRKNKLPDPLKVTQHNQYVEINKRESAIDRRHKSKSNESGNIDIDINTLMEKSKNMDLPLIAALCNDQSLLKQTKAFIPEKSQTESITSNEQCSKTINQSISFSSDKCVNPSELKIKQGTLREYGKKTYHRHPNDKLPDIPSSDSHTPRALSNTYVMHPVKNNKIPPRT